MEQDLPFKSRSPRIACSFKERSNLEGRRLTRRAPFEVQHKRACRLAAVKNDEMAICKRLLAKKHQSGYELSEGLVHLELAI